MTDLYQSSIAFSSPDKVTPSVTSGLSANQVHAELRRLADSSFSQGKLFEHVMVKYFLQASLYRDKLKDVRLWDDWAHEHGIDGRDVGIDLVADTCMTGSTGLFSASVTTKPTPFRSQPLTPFSHPPAKDGEKRILYFPKD